MKSIPVGGCSHSQNSFQIHPVSEFGGFQERASVMKRVPRFLRGQFRIVLRCATEEIMAGVRSQSVDREENGWRLFLLLPRTYVQQRPMGSIVDGRWCVAHKQQSADAVAGTDVTMSQAG